MEDFGKDILSDIEENQYGLYVGHVALYFPSTAIGTKFINSDYPQDMAFHIFYVAKNLKQIKTYDDIIKQKATKEIGNSAEKITSEGSWVKINYCVIASDVDYESQEVIQPDFSIIETLKSLNAIPMARKTYFHYSSELKNKMEEIGIYDDVKEFRENLLEDMVKANQMGYMKENIQEDTVGMDQYGFWMIPITIYETIPDGTGGALVEDYTIYFAAQNKEQTETYENIVKEKLLQEYNVEIIGGKRINQDKVKQWLADGQSRISVKTEWPTYCYSVVAASFDFSTQDMLQPDYSIKQNLKNITNPKGHVDYRFQKGLYSDLLLKAINVGVYKKEDEFKEYYFEDMVKMVQLGLDGNVTECCCAGGMGGGVTTASFAPVVTHTVYPRPGSKKKKKSKKESDESLVDVYGFYGCVVRLSLSFPGSDTKIRKYYVVLGKDLGQIDEFNQKINQNIKQISNDSCILSTTLTGILYSTEIKDFDFEGQKILDSNLYVDNPKQFASNEKELDREEVQIRDIIGRSYDDLTDFTSDLFTKMTEDTDDVYWPVRNNETDAFEQEIRNQRQAKKDKIIARKEKTIEKRNQTLANWIARVGDTMDLVKMKSMIDNYNKTTAKHIMELERIKKLPIDSPEFL